MNAVSPLTAVCIGLLTYLLYFVVDAFPLLNRSASFFTLSLLSFVAIVIIVFDGVRKTESDASVIWTYIALACTLVIATAHLFVWFIGGVLA